MADISIPITIPDDRMDDAVAALRYHYGKRGDGTDYTPTELRALLKSDVETDIKDMYKRWRRETAQTDDLPLS